MDPILIDECLSPKLASVARERGLVAFHALWVGMEGAEDWDLAALAAERDYVIPPSGTTSSSPTTAATFCGCTPSLRSITA
jgi:predicted nuclease of predicted toxin-antitoxin system